MKKFLVGKRISLHGLTPHHLEFDQPYYHWLDDLSLDRYTERSYYPNNSERMKNYYEQACLNNIILLGIFDNESDRHIGNISFSEIDHLNRRAFLGYLLGDKSFAGRGIITEATLMMMYYGFNKLNFERIHGGISDLNEASKRVATKAGLKVEGRLRNHFFRNGQFSDSLLVGALRSEWMEELGEKASKLFEVHPTY